MVACIVLLWLTKLSTHSHEQRFDVYRPDVMAKYVTRIEADKKLCPVLLSNGNLLEEGDLDDNRCLPASPPPDILSNLHCSDESGTTGISSVLCLAGFCAQTVKATRASHCPACNMPHMCLSCITQLGTSLQAKYSSCDRTSTHNHICQAVIVMLSSQDCMQQASMQNIQLSC